MYPDIQAATDDELLQRAHVLQAEAGATQLVAVYGAAESVMLDSVFLVRTRC